MKTLRLLLALLLAMLVLATAAHGQGFAQNKHFVVYAPTQELSETILNNAEGYRESIARQWLDRPPTSGPSVIYVDIRPGARGYTWKKDHPDRLYHNIYLLCSERNATGPVLAHEVCHTVFADYRVPRGLEERIALTYNAPSTAAERAALRRQLLPVIKKAMGNR